MPRFVLIVDDDPSFRGVIAAAVSDEGYPVRIAANGAEALALHTATPASLIATDIQMPRLNGPKLVMTLRARGDMTPVIFFSGGVKWVPRLPHTTFLSKPFDLGEFLNFVNIGMAVPIFDAQPTTPYDRDKA